MLEEVGEVHLPDLQELEVVVEPFVKEKLRPALEPEPWLLEREVPVPEECGGFTLTTPLESKCKFFENWFHQSSRGISGSVCEFISNFLRRIVKKMGQKLILGDNFINKNSDDFYVLQLWFFDIFGLDYQK